MYYIRQKSDPTKYLAGTPTYRHWKADNGRLFSTIGKLRAFITNAMKTRNSMHDWEIVEVEMVVKDVKELTDVVKPEKIMELLQR